MHPGNSAAGRPWHCSIAERPAVMGAGSRSAFSGFPRPRRPPALLSPDGSPAPEDCVQRRRRGDALRGQWVLSQGMPSPSASSRRRPHRVRKNSASSQLRICAQYCRPSQVNAGVAGGGEDGRGAGGPWAFPAAGARPSAAASTRTRNELVCPVGIEPTTIRLKVECSTTELPARVAAQGRRAKRRGP